MRPILLPSLLLLALLTGCAPNGTEPTPPTEDAASGTRDASAPASTPISPEYLAGSWCFAYYEAGGEREEQGITYVFREDGTLLYQTNPTTPVDREGSYTIDGNELEIRPALLVAPRQIGAATEDEFTLERGSTRFVFTRGACG